MNEIVSATVAHRHGKVKAVRRLQEGLARTQGQLGPMVTMDQTTWQGDTSVLRMRALGQTAAGRIEVLDDALRIDVTLPSLLAKAADRLLSISAQGNHEAPGTVEVPTVPFRCGDAARGSRQIANLGRQWDFANVTRLQGFNARPVAQRFVAPKAKQTYKTEMDEDATMAMLPQNARLAAREAA